jgi:hydroxymethylpyrimidine/phosphomethylpyrimidine kinase
VSSEPIRTAITIAGSDSGGGAGIEADLKAFASCGVHGTAAITALTAQNTLGVEAIHAVPPEIIVAQVRAVADDIGIDAAKVGMLGDEPTIDAAVEALGLIGDAPVVVDPVMVAESGAVLVEKAARTALVEEVLPLATVATPNIAEARELTGLGDDATQDELARAVHALGPRAVVVTGGHSEGGEDVLYEGEGEPWRIEGPVHRDGASHGSGCTHSSVIAATLAQGETVRDAAFVARAITAAAIEWGLRELGGGAGPVDVFGLAAPEE